MTITPIPDSQSQFGQTLAFAERTMSAGPPQALLARLESEGLISGDSDEPQDEPTVA